MKTLSLAVWIAASTCFIPVNALAADGAALFKQHNCAMCHAATSASMGPSLQAIAKKYAGNKDAAASLAAKVRSGGKGSFGEMSMPATPASVSDADIQAMVSWMLKQ